MKFSDIRLVAKTGGGRDMTAGELFKGMAGVIREIAGTGQESGDWATKTEMGEMIGHVSETINERIDEVEAATNLRLVQIDDTLSTQGQTVDQTFQKVSDHEARIDTVEKQMPSIAQQLEMAGQEINRLNGVVDGLEGRIAALEAKE